MTRKNPKVGMHPDLFEGQSPTWVPIADLTRKQLLTLPRSAFSLEEWVEELDDDIREYIYKHDEESKDRIASFATPFITVYEWRKHASNTSLLEEYGEDFHHWLANMPDVVSCADKDEVTELVGHYIELGVPEGDILPALEDAMADTNNYEEEISTSCYRDPTQVYSSIIRTHLYLDTRHEFSTDDHVDFTLKQAYDALHPDELELAIEKVNDETDDAWWLTDEKVERTMAGKHGTFEATLELDKCLVATPKWEWIKDDLNGVFDISSIEEARKVAAGFGEAPPEEGRIFHRFKDGAYVLDLHPSELADESKQMGMCVGDPKYGYGEAIESGETKIMSLRTQGGRPKLTFEVALEDGAPSHVEQIKGKANRLPGWDRAKEGQGKIKQDEVNKAIAVVKKLGLDPEDVEDLEVSLNHMQWQVDREKRRKARENPRDKVHCGFCRQPA